MCEIRFIEGCGGTEKGVEEYRGIEKDVEE